MKEINNNTWSDDDLKEYWKLVRFAHSIFSREGIEQSIKDFIDRPDETFSSLMNIENELAKADGIPYEEVRELTDEERIVIVEGAKRIYEEFKRGKK